MTKKRMANCEFKNSKKDRFKYYASIFLLAQLCSLQNFFPTVHMFVSS